ncbi:hypothetical protein A6V25_17265 [Nostoc sp. ATCC 53789]|nr:hypothetical protein A6V25_17265 [Nostoc sp. ATCC 53789]
MQLKFRIKNVNLINRRGAENTEKENEFHVKLEIRVYVSVQKCYKNQICRFKIDTKYLSNSHISVPSASLWFVKQLATTFISKET